MKKIMNISARFAATCMMAVLMVHESFGQDTTVYTTTTTTTAQDLWYMQPWVWIVGGAAILLLLIAMFSGKSKSKSRTDRVIITKTVRSETDVD